VIELHAFDDPHAQAGALSKAVSDALQASFVAPGHPPGNTPGASRTTLAVSGGTSPRLFLQTLAQAPLDWQRVDVTLVDDRWVPETDAASNARLLHEALLTGAASAARFLPLVDISSTIEAHIAALNADASRLSPNVAVLGMGEDGHTASLFADGPADEWAHATSPNAPRFVVGHPHHAPHARVSLSLAALTGIERLFLLIAGQRKLDVLNAAASTPQDNAISKLANHKGVRLDVYWCAK
jgi:6-phosphogluconolactonase